MATPATATATVADTATPNKMPPLDEAWKAAQKLRIAVNKEIEIIQKGGQGANEVARFEKIEKLMENYRLASIEIIWIDVRFATENKVDESLWMTHSQITRTYRKIIGKLTGPDNTVLKRRLDRLYAAYLKTAQYFYKGWMQRVCARYGDSVQNLKRIARMAELEMVVPDGEKVDAATQQVDVVVRELCHKTLIYLGDLARYRVLQRTKDRKWETAVAYYALANELIPESGFGHHQSAVIYDEMGDHLQVVYHLYRAMACEKPHPNAPANLERHFRDLQKQKGGGTKHALVTWFVKLHAYYYQGKEFNERKELENEVDHRLAVAMKSGTHLDSDTDLLKIVLINITSYVVGQQKIQADWNEERSRSCQYILLLNIRTIHTICRLLKDEITELIERTPVATGSSTTSSAQTKQEGKFTAVLNRIMPLLRVYMTWLCSYNSDLVKYQPYLEPQFGSMCAMLSTTLSLLFELLGSDTRLGTAVGWQFLEDELTIGIQCLNGPHLHDGCQLYYDAFKRKPKPRREEFPDAVESPDDVTFTRALDVALCALDLAAPESEFPLDTSKKAKGSQEHTTIVYLPGGKPKPAPRVQVPQQFVPVETFTESPRKPELQVPTAESAPTQAPAPAPAPAPEPTRTLTPPSPVESNELSEDQEFYGPRLRKFSHGAIKASNNSRPRTATANPTQAASVSESSIENQIYQILSDILIDDSETGQVKKFETPTRPVPLDETSYGMGSTTAQNVFANSSDSPGPGSATSKTFPTLPWNYFYTPAPVGNPAVRNSTETSGSGTWNSSFSSRTNQPGSGAELAGGYAYQSPLAAQPLQHQTSSSGAGDRAMWPDTGVSLATQGTSSSKPLHGDNIWGPSGSTWQTGQGTAQTSTAAGFAPNSPFSSLSFSQTSTLPPVNSPWGLSSRGQGTANHQRVASHSPLTTNIPHTTYTNPLATSSVNAPPGFGPVPMMGQPSAPVRRHASEQLAVPKMSETYDKQVLMNAWLEPYARHNPDGMEMPQNPLHLAVAGDSKPNVTTAVDWKQYTKR